MESDDYKVPDNIIQLLFANDKMKKGSKELLESFINSKMENKNTKETLKLILESFKAVLFDINTEYKDNNINIVINEYELNHPANNNKEEDKEET